MASAERAEIYIGNVSESADLARRVLHARETGECLEVEITRGDRTKGRILTQTASGQLVGIVKERDFLLKDGDLLLSESGYMVLVSIQQQRVMSLRFDSDAENRAIALVHLGHALGNQHWPVTAKGDVLYVELVADASLMESTLRKIAKRLNIKGLHISFETNLSDKAIDFSVDHSHAH